VIGFEEMAARSRLVSSWVTYLIVLAFQDRWRSGFAALARLFVVVIVGIYINESALLSSGDFWGYHAKNKTVYR
jgi:hypothetical protein